MNKPRLDIPNYADIFGIEELEPSIPLDNPRPNRIMGYNTVIKKSGDHITLKSYDSVNVFNYQTKSKLDKAKGESENTEENYYHSLRRARQNVFDIISCNVYQVPDIHGNYQEPKFITLTFKENITDLKQANTEFTKFNKRLSYHLYKVRKNVLKYIAVPEFQKRGAVHYHVLYFNLPYLKVQSLSEVWGKGYVWIEGIKDNIHDYALYVAKYINKENSAGESNFEIYKEKNMLNEKRYFCSNGLNRPKIHKLLMETKTVEDVVQLLKPTLTNEFITDSEFRGEILINQYKVEDEVYKDTLDSIIYDVEENMFDIYNINKLKNKNTVLGC